MSEVVAAEMLRAVLTKKGLAAANQAATLGKPVKISHVGVTGTPGTPNADMTTLPGEVGGRLKIADGKVISDTQVNVSTLLPDTFPSVTIHGVGHYLEDGTLFSVYQSTTPLLIHTQGATLMIGMDFVLENIPSGSVIVESTGANLIMGDWVPTYRKLNGYVMDKDINLTAKDVKAAPEGFGLGTNGVGVGGTSRFLASPHSNAPGLPGLGAGFQSTYGGNRRAQLYVTTDGLTRSRFSLSDDVADTATPWAIHYTTLNKPAPSEIGAVPSLSVVLGSGSDFNNFEETNNYNVYRGSNGTFNNAPEGLDYGTLQVIGRNKAGASFVTQIATCKATTKQWVRTRNDGAFAWGPWRKVYSEAQKPSPADIGAAASSHTHQDYVPKTRKVNGKELTGDITITLEELGFKDPDLSGYVPKDRTVNNKALNADVTLNHRDVKAAPEGYGLGTDGPQVADANKTANVNAFYAPIGDAGVNFFNKYSPLIQGFRAGGADQTGQMLQMQASNETIAFRLRSSNNWTGWIQCYTPFNKPSPSDLGAAAANHGHSDLVPITRKVNNKELRADIALNAADVGAQALTKLIRSTHTYQVSAANPKLLLGADGKEVVKNCSYLVRLVTTTTNTITGNIYTLRADTNGVWLLKAIARNGTSSNNPELSINSAGKPQITTAHASTYDVVAIMEEFDQKTHGGRPWFELEHFYSPDNKPTPAALGVVAKAGDSNLGRLSGQGFSTVSTDGKDSVAFEYIDGVPVIRYGGSGAGSNSGLRVMGPANKLKALIDDSGEIHAKGNQKVFHPQNLPTAAQIGALPTKVFSQHNNYCTVAIPLIPKSTDGADRFNLHRLHGHLHFRRGGSGQTNRMEVLALNVQTAYNQTFGSLTATAYGSGWDFRLCEFTHKGKVWLGLISQHKNAQDFEAVWAGIDVWGGAPAGYDRVDQFSVIAVERSGSPSDPDAVLNTEIKNSLKLWGVNYLRDGAGYLYVSGSRKVNGKELKEDISLNYQDVKAAPEGFGIGTNPVQKDPNKELLGGLWRNVDMASAGITLPYDGTPSAAYYRVSMTNRRAYLGTKSNAGSDIRWEGIYSENHKPTLGELGAAPAGYGLGTDGPQVADANKTANVNAFYAPGGESSVNYFNKFSPMIQAFRAGGADQTGQMLQIQGSNETLAFRMRNNNQWLDWVKCYTPFNKPTAADVGALPSNGTAAAANKLATPRKINGTSFDGQGDITTNYWGYKRNFTIGNATMGVDGSGNVSWTLAQIGAASPEDVTNAANNVKNWVNSNYDPVGSGQSARDWAYSNCLGSARWGGTAHFYTGETDNPPEHGNGWIVTTSSYAEYNNRGGNICRQLQVARGGQWVTVGY